MFRSLQNILPILISILGTSLSLSAEEIIIYLRAVDNFSGDELEAEYRVRSTKTNNSYTLKVEDGERYFELREGDEVKVEVQLEGYYPEEKILAANDILSAEDEVIFKLKRRPTAKLVLQALEPVRGRGVPAEFKVYLGNTLLGRGSTSKGVKTFDLLLTENGTYKILSKAESYSEIETFIDVEVSTPVNNISKDIELEPSAREVIVSFVEEQLGKPVQPKITIVNKATGKELYNEQPGNGMLKFVFKKDEIYEIRAEAEGFKNFIKDVKGPVTTDLKNSMRAVTEVRLVARDFKTKKVLDAVFNVETPDGQKIRIAKGEPFYPTVKGSYKLTPEYSGYIPKSTGSITINSLSGGVIPHEPFMDRAGDSFKIKIIDRYTREPILDPDFKVFAKNGIQLSGLEANAEGVWTVPTSSEQTYFIEVSSPDYNDVTKNLKPEQNPLTVEMYWRPELTYTLKVVDDVTKEPVEEAELTVKKADGSSLFLYKTEEPGIYLAKITKGEALNYIIKSKTYEENLASMSNEAKNTQILYLKRKDINEIFIVFEDKLTGEKIKPDYRVTRNGQLVATDNDRIAVDDDAVFALKAVLQDYQNLDIADLNSLSGSVIAMAKKAYPLQIVVTNLKSKSEYSDLKLILEQDGNRALSVAQKNDLTYEVYVPPTSKYVLAIVKDGFEPFTKSFELSKVPVRNGICLLEVTLSPKETKIIAEATAKPKPAPEPKEPVDLSKDIQEILSQVPSSKQAVAAELNDKASIGKRYFLDKVAFDQGSPRITEQNIEQLNIIAGALADHPNVKIEIVGHTDNVGDSRRNIGLSQFRAKAVANYLFNKGANPDKIIVIGKGDTAPIAPNDSEENKEKNRRVEMVLVEN